MSPRLLLSWLLILGALWCSRAAEVMPPKPARYFNDYANVVPAATAGQLNRTLEDFEKKSSSQVVVVVYKKMQSDSSVEDYTVRVAQSWHIGQKEKNNGAVLFVFLEDRQIYLQVGYGLEGAIPDAIAKQIIEQEIKPAFKGGDFPAGLTAGVNAIIKAATGEYQGTGRTVNQGRQRGKNNFSGVFMIMFLLLIMASKLNRRGGTLYTGGGRRYWTGGSRWGGGGGWSGGSGGGGGFSGGGGSFGGGGAGGKW